MDACQVWENFFFLKNGLYFFFKIKIVIYKILQLLVFTMMQILLIKNVFYVPQACKIAYHA